VKVVSCLNQNLMRHCRKFFLLLLILALPLCLGAWSITMNRGGINPNYVDKIQDGKTKKSEILTLFGDPQETKHTPEGVIFVYETYTTKETAPKRSAKDKDEGPNTTTAVDSPFSLEQNLKRKSSKEGPTKELSSSLTVFFGQDGDTVRSHEFRRVKE
jgi:hypothetical protein